MEPNYIQEPESQPSEKSSAPNWLARLAWQGKVMPAFWTVSGLISLVVNIILLAALILLGREVFTLKEVLHKQLVMGLAENFALMDESVIATTVMVNNQIPVQFVLPISRETTVILTQDTWLTNARVNLATGGLSIVNAPTDILLPAGMPLNIQLEMEVPVDALIPINLPVEVNIPLKETDLHVPFVGLQEVVAPYNRLLWQLPNSWEEVFCLQGENLLCTWVR